MSTKSYIYKVEFKEPINNKTSYFFGSLSAIFVDFTPAEIGCKVTRLWNIGITEKSPYIGRKCTISKEPLARKKRKGHNV